MEKDYEPAAVPAKERTSVTFNDDIMMMRSYIEASPETVAAPAEPVYKSAAREEAVPYEAPVTVKKPVRVSDIMPVIAAKRAAETEKEQKQEKIAAPRDKILSHSMKKALIAYLSIVIVLTIAVIITGVAISSVSASIAGDEAAATTLTQTIALQQAELESLSDPETLGKLAAELNMTEVTTSVTTPLVPIREKETVSNTNPWDAFLDWMGSIFGLGG